MVPFSINSQPSSVSSKRLWECSPCCVTESRVGIQPAPHIPSGSCILTLAAGQAVILMDKTKEPEGTKIHILEPGEDLPPGNLGEYGKNRIFNERLHEKQWKSSLGVKQMMLDKACSLDLSLLYHEMRAWPSRPLPSLCSYDTTSQPLSPCPYHHQQPGAEM